MEKIIGRKVEYQKGVGTYCTGVIIQHFELTGVFVVRNDEDGSLWRGWKDQMAFLEEEVA